MGDRSATVITQREWIDRFPKESPKLKIKNAVVISNQGCFLQDSARMAHCDALADSQTLQVCRLHTSTVLNTNYTLATSNCLSRNTWRTNRHQALSSRLKPAFTNVSGAFWQSRQIFASD